MTRPGLLAAPGLLRRRASARIERLTAVAAGRPLVRATLRGFQGGLIATAVMTVYRLPVFRALPPTAEFWARYVGGGDAEEYFLEGLLLHFLYGGVAGGVFGGGFAALTARVPLSRERLGLVCGLGYGAVLSVVGTRVVFRRVLDRGLETEHTLVFHVGHVIYGLTLGTWISTREPVGEVYD